jgi:hypothetical protein
MTEPIDAVDQLPPPVRRAAERLASLAPDASDHLVSAIDQHLSRSCTSQGAGDQRAAELAARLRQVLAQFEPTHADQHRAIAGAAARYLEDPLGCTDDDDGAWYVNADRAALDQLLDWLRRAA